MFDEHLLPPNALLARSSACQDCEVFVSQFAEFPVGHTVESPFPSKVLFGPPVLV
jgi:hypothetical protein